MCGLIIFEHRLFWRGLLSRKTPSEGTIVITVWFDHARLIGIDFQEKDERGFAKHALLGDCKFSSDKLIVTPREGEDQLFNGEYDTITFTRTDLESASA